MELKRKMGKTRFGPRTTGEGGGKKDQRDGRRCIGLVGGGKGGRSHIGRWGWVVRREQN